MIGHVHTPDGLDFMVGFDHIPRQGEFLVIGGDAEKDERDGTYEVVRVLHNPPERRMDFYCQRVGDYVRKRGWSDIMGPTG